MRPRVLTRLYTSVNDRAAGYVTAECDEVVAELTELLVARLTY